MLGPLLYIDDLYNVVSNSTLKLFTDDVALFREINCPVDCSMLQQDLDNIYSWTAKWQLWLNASKCGNKMKPPTYLYTINGVTVSWNSVVKHIILSNLPCHGLIIVELSLPRLDDR